MTEYELGEILHNNYGGLWQAAQMYFTLVSAYLAVAYLVGAKLTKGQNLVVTGLYLVWIAGVIQAQYTTSTQTMRISDELILISSTILPAADKAQTQAGIFSFIVVQVFGVIASLWFMWSLRHHKKE